MTYGTIDIDGDKAKSMLDRLGDAPDHLTPTLQSAATKAANSMYGIPVDTGRLASSPRAGRVSNRSAWIVSDVEYAPYVFYGTRYMAARPPQMTYSAADLAEDVGHGVFDEY